MNFSKLKKPILLVATLSVLGGCETLQLDDLVDVLSVADGSLGDLAKIDSLDALEEMSDTDAILTGVAIAADIVASVDSVETKNTISTPTTSRSVSPSQLNHSDKGTSSFDGTTFKFTCPGGYSDPYEVPMPYKGAICLEAAKEFSQVFVCNQVSKMEAAQTAFYSKCADQIYD